jgi:hypothetical protein
MSCVYTLFCTVPQTIVLSIAFQECPKTIISVTYVVSGAGISEAVQCLTTDWTAGVQSPAVARDFFL